MVAKKLKHYLNKSAKPLFRLLGLVVRSRRVRRLFRPLGDLVYHALAIGLVLLILAFTLGRLWLPMLAERKAELAGYLSQHSPYQVQMEQLSPYWDGLNPGLRLEGFSVHSADTGLLAIRFDEVRVSLSWLSLLTGRISINSLVLVQPRLTMERLTDGRFRISGLGAIEQQATPQDAGLMQWLFQQNELIVEDGEIQWIDQFSKDPPMRLSLVNMALRNRADNHHLEFEAVFPKNICRECRLVADIQGNPMEDADWKGNVYLRAIGVDARALPRIVRERLPSGLEGRLSVQLATDWRHARPAAVQGKLEVTALRLPIPGYEAIAIKGASAGIDWAASDDGREWRLDLDRLVIGFRDRPWTAGDMRIDYQPGDVSVRVQHVNMTDLALFMREFPGDMPALQWLRAAQPGGMLDDFSLRVQGELGAPTAYSLETEVGRLTWQPYQKLPGMRGLSGHLSAAETGGEFRIASTSMVLGLPHLFQAPVTVHKASGQLAWQRDEAQWRISGKDLSVLAEDGRLGGYFDVRIPHDVARSPVLDMRLDFSDMNGDHAANYYPVQLPQALREWLVQSVISGRVTSGHAVYSGALRDFPFRDGSGRFEVRAHVTNGVFEYLPDWPRIENIDADLLFSGPALTVTGSRGRIRGLDVGRVGVTVADLHPPEGAQVHVVGQVSGPLDQTLAVLYESKTGSLSEYLLPGLKGSGNGLLDLDIVVPVRTPLETRWTGLYRFDHSGVHLPIGDVGISDIRGSLLIGDRGVVSGRVQADMLGEPASLEIGTAAGKAADATVMLQARSKLGRKGLEHLLGPGFSARLQGEIPWELGMQFANHAVNLEISADLKGLESGLPEPLNKPGDTPLLLSLKTRASSPGAHDLDFRLGNRAQGRFLFHRAPGGGWGFARGRLDVGAASTVMPETDGLAIGLRSATLDADRWWQVIDEAAHGQGARGLPGFITRVSADLGRLELFGRAFGRFSMDVTRLPLGWHGHLKGDMVNGSVLVSTQESCNGGECARAPGEPHPAIILTLDQLVIPAVSDANGARPVSAMDPRAMPELHIKSRAFRLAERNMGELEFDALPAANGWKIGKLNIRQPLMDLQATGDWRYMSGNGQRTEIEARLLTPDLGGLLAQFGYDSEIAGGRMDATSSWSWSGSPAEFSLPRLDGLASVTIRDGRLVQVKQGAGRLLGVIDARALSRYLALDFSTLFGKGYIFDSIRGQAAVEKGNAYSRDLFIKGPSADIGITGRVGLAAHDLDLDIRVSPRFRGELAVTGILLGTPVVGMAVLAAQEILKKPLAEGTRIDYTVKGDWDNPQIYKVQKQTLGKPNSEQTE